MVSIKAEIKCTSPCVCMEWNATGETLAIMQVITLSIMFIASFITHRSTAHSIVLPLGIKTQVSFSTLLDSQPYELCLHMIIYNYFF